MHYLQLLLQQNYTIAFAIISEIIIYFLQINYNSNCHIIINGKSFLSINNIRNSKTNVQNHSPPFIDLPKAI